MFVFSDADDYLLDLCLSMMATNPSPLHFVAVLLLQPVFQERLPQSPKNVYRKCWR